MGAHLSSPVAFLIQCINFAILVGVLVKFGKKPFKDYLTKRRHSVKERIEEAERLLKEASELKAIYVGKLSALEGEIEAFRASAMAEMEKERTKILDEARELASRIREQARLAYEQEMKEAMARVRSRSLRADDQGGRADRRREVHERGPRQHGRRVHPECEEHQLIRQSIARRYAKGLFAVGEKDGQIQGLPARARRISDRSSTKGRRSKGLS